MKIISSYPVIMEEVTNHSEFHVKRLKSKNKIGEMSKLFGLQTQAGTPVYTNNRL